MTNEWSSLPVMGRPLLLFSCPSYQSEWMNNDHWITSKVLQWKFNKRNCTANETVILGSYLKWVGQREHFSVDITLSRVHISDKVPKRQNVEWINCFSVNAVNCQLRVKHKYILVRFVLLILRMLRVSVCEQLMVCVTWKNLLLNGLEAGWFILDFFFHLEHDYFLADGGVFSHLRNVLLYHKNLRVVIFVAKAKTHYILDCVSMSGK